MRILLSHSTFFVRRRMGSGGLRGLQNRCFGAEASKGWFDSDTPPPSWESGVGSWGSEKALQLPIPDSLLRRTRQEADLHRAALMGPVHRLPRPPARHLVLGIDEDDAAIPGTPLQLRPAPA